MHELVVAVSYVPRGFTLTLIPSKKVIINLNEPEKFPETCWRQFHPGFSSTTATPSRSKWKWHRGSHQALTGIPSLFFSIDGGPHFYPNNPKSVRYLFDLAERRMKRSNTLVLLHMYESNHPLETVASNIAGSKISVSHSENLNDEDLALKDLALPTSAPTKPPPSVINSPWEQDDANFTSRSNLLLKETAFQDTEIPPLRGVLPEVFPPAPSMNTHMIQFPSDELKPRSVLTEQTSPPLTPNSSSSSPSKPAATRRISSSRLGPKSPVENVTLIDNLTDAIMLLDENPPLNKMTLDDSQMIPPNSPEPSLSQPNHAKDLESTSSKEVNVEFSLNTKNPSYQVPPSEPNHAHLPVSISAPVLPSIRIEDTSSKKTPNLRLDSDSNSGNINNLLKEQQLRSSQDNLFPRSISEYGSNFGNHSVNPSPMATRERIIDFSAPEKIPPLPEVDETKSLGSKRSDISNHDILFCFPATSYPAQIVEVTSLAIIFVSLISFCVETIPKYRLRDVYGTITLSNGTNITGVIKEEEYYHPTFFSIETFCIAWFTMEFFLKIIAFRNNLNLWAQSWMTWLDLVAIIPYYFSLGFSGSSASSLAIVRIVRLARVARLAKLSRVSPGLVELTMALVEAGRQLWLFMLIAVMNAILFGSIIFYVELGVKNQDGLDLFVSIPEGMWWAVVTMTTVGYGDVVPLSPLGRLVGGVCASFGVVTVAAAAGIFISSFMQCRDELKEAKLEEEEEQEEFDEHHLALELHTLLREMDMTLRRNHPDITEAMHTHLTHLPAVKTSMVSFGRGVIHIEDPLTSALHHPNKRRTSTAH